MRLCSGTIGIILVSLFARPSFAGDAAPSPGRLEVSFDFQESKSMASNQFAIWVADADDVVVKTLAVTDFTGRRRGWEFRENSLPLWVKSAEVETLAKESVDAVSRATPPSGEVRVVWDCRDQNGNPVPPGDYKIFVECSVRDESRLIYLAEIEVGGNPAEKKPEPIRRGYFSAGILRTPMISGLTIKYLP
ncbi:MAG: DUF2271 domain-containing protein [Planctomycetota bacterium]|nr:DUF2271 domain-containing protein [Planctomycetota bacterium]